jgi:hypothetical protein
VFEADAEETVPILFQEKMAFGSPCYAEHVVRRKRYLYFRARHLQESSVW